VFFSLDLNFNLIQVNDWNRVRQKEALKGQSALQIGKLQKLSLCK
jgi:hypothetical protein